MSAVLCGVTDAPPPTGPYVLVLVWAPWCQDWRSLGFARTEQDGCEAATKAGYTGERVQIVPRRRAP